MNMDYDLLTSANDPSAEALAQAVATLTSAITSLADDPGALLTEPAQLAWDAIHEGEPAEFERLRSRAKAAGARVSGIDKLVSTRNKRLQDKIKANTQKNYTSYTSNISNDLAEENSPSWVYEVLDSAIPYTPGMLVEGSDKPKLMIVSDAALVARDAMRGRFARSREAAAWHHFTGTHWEPAPSAAGVHQVLTAWLYPTTTPLGFTPHYQDALLTLLERGNMLPLPESPPGQLPFQNGILTLATLEFKPITPASAATWCLPYDYTPGADCPTIKAWLKTAVDGDEPTVELLRAWWAALLTGRADLQKFLHLPGPGGTGKGVFMRVCEALVGPHNTASTDLKTLEQNRFEAASLYRKRLVLISDTDKYGGSVNVLKALTGQDAIRLERKNVQQNGTFRFDGQVLIASNEALATTDLTSGLERRRITVAFRRQVSDAEREQWRRAGGEIAVLHREIPGLVNWVLALSPEQVSAAITSPPDRTREQNLDALTAGNPVAGWLVECVKPEAGAWTQIGSKDERRRPEDGFMYYPNAETMLYPSYLAWSRRTGRSPVALRRFRHVAADMARTLGASLQEVRRGAGMGIEGLRLLDTNDEPYAWSISSSGVGSVASGAQLQDQSAPKPLSMLEVQDMQDFRPNFDSLPATTAIGQESGAAEIWI